MVVQMSTAQGLKPERRAWPPPAMVQAVVQAVIGQISTNDACDDGHCHFLHHHSMLGSPAGGLNDAAQLLNRINGDMISCLQGGIASCNKAHQ